MAQGIEMLGGGTAGNQVMGNYIGTDARGAFDLGNAYDGVIIANAPGNTIGGLDPAPVTLFQAMMRAGSQLSARCQQGTLCKGTPSAPTPCANRISATRSTAWRSLTPQGIPWAGHNLAVSARTWRGT